jgi:hypothetical protein
MPGIIEFPQVVQEALKQFGDLFANQPQRRHFAEILNHIHGKQDRFGRPRATWGI